jgi:hypothetical protein
MDVGSVVTNLHPSTGEAFISGAAAGAETCLLFPEHPITSSAETQKRRRDLE